MARQRPGGQIRWPAKLNIHRVWLFPHRPEPLGEEIEGGEEGGKEVRAGWAGAARLSLTYPREQDGERVWVWGAIF